MATSSNLQLIVSDISCSNLRFYDPDKQLVTRSTAVLRFQLGKRRHRTTPHPKSADPSWPDVQVFKNLEPKLKNSILRVEAWDFHSEDKPKKSRPLGFVELSLVNVLPDVPFPFTGQFFHTEGCCPPPDRLPPMELAMVLLWTDNPHPVSCVSSGIAKNYVDLRRLFPTISREVLDKALVRNNFDIPKAADYIIEKLQVKALASKKAEGKSSTEMSILEKCKSFTDLRANLLHPVAKNGTIPLGRELYPPAPLKNLPTKNGFIDRRALHGRRKALLIGLNYKGTKKELNGCHDDVERMRKLITNLYGFVSHPSLMTVLSDESADQRLWPTRSNIILACQWLTHDVVPGDVLYFHFSGHGSQQQDLHGTETDGYDESIMPLDYKTKGHIVDDELYDLLVKPLPNGVKLIALMDCCHSGTALDLPFLWDLKTKTWKEERCPKYCEGDVILFAGCQDEQTSADVHIPKWGSGGAMTMSLVTTLSNDPFGLTVKELILSVHNSMRGRGLGQLPQLSVTQRFDVDRPFDFNSNLLNTNKLIGQDMKASKVESQRQGRTYMAKPLKGTAKKAVL